MACPSFTKQTELDWVYLRMIREIIISLLASSVSSLFSSHDVGDQLVVDVQLLTALLEGYAVHLLVLDRSRYISRIDLNHVVVSFFLLIEGSPEPPRYSPER